MQVSIKAPRVTDEESLADELERIARMIRNGFTCGEVHGGWWGLSGEYAEPEEAE